MVIGATSSRRPRSSVGQTQDFFSEGPSQQTFDVEFRRKHSRQNKEIITENVRHKTAMKVLNDEIGSLKEEIMEVKQINRILSLQMKKMKEDQKRSCSPATVQAIDALIAAMPALHVLRQSLTPVPSPLPVFEAEVSRRNILRNIGMTVGTRPANQGGNLLDLDTLGEDEEEEEYATHDIRNSVHTRPPTQPSPLSVANSRAVNVKSKSKTPAKRLNITASKGSSGSPISKAMPRSPLPQSKQNTIDMSVDSPLSSASSTPVKTASTTPKKKARRRRESGLIPPVPSVNEDLPSTPIPAAVSSSSPANEKEQLHDAIEQSSPGPGRYENASQNILSESVSSSSTVSSAPTSFSDMSYVDEDGKRGRRSRMSVNYKEPSLAKKMRKPDGLAIAEALGRRQSTNENEDGILRHPVGVRRKSVLPNSLARLSETRSDGESDTGDVDDIDACLGLEVNARTRQKSPDSSASGSTLTEPLSSLLSSSRSSRDDIERVPTPIPPMHADPHPVEEDIDPVSRLDTQTTDQLEVVASQSAAPLRTSPRKASSVGTTQSTRNKTRRSSVLPIKTSARVATVPVGRNRTALADVPEPNAKAKSVAGETEGSVKPRTGASARR